MMQQKGNKLKIELKVGPKEMLFLEPNRRAKSIALNDAGFSMVELLITLSILTVVTALAVPNYLAARARANEASAASSVRAIISAQNLYRNTFGYFADLPSLGEDYLTDKLLAAGNKSGYVFDSTPGGSSSLQFTVEATPTLSIGPAATGGRSYFGDQSAVIRFSLTGAADSTSAPLQ
jgi:prepilin-type N-terminal cleavage/methylation domain-containing protein